VGRPVYLVANDLYLFCPLNKFERARRKVRPYRVADRSEAC